MITLSNDVVLTDDGWMQKGDYRQLSRDKVRKVFVDRSTEHITTSCRIHNNDRSCDETFGVLYNRSSISIGCVEFNADDIAKVKEWLNEKEGAVPTESGQPSQRVDNPQSAPEAGSEGPAIERNSPSSSSDSVAQEPAEARGNQAQSTES